MNQLQEEEKGEPLVGLNKREMKAQMKRSRHQQLHQQLMADIDAFEATGRVLPEESF
jgi:hypothetical protein